MKQVVRTFAPSLALGICVLFGASACNETGTSNGGGGGGGGQPIVSENSPTFAPTPSPLLNQPVALPEIKPPAFEVPKPPPIADIKPELLIKPPAPSAPGTIHIPSSSSLPSAPVISGPGAGLPIPVHAAPPVEPPKPAIKFAADLKLVEFDLTNRRRSRGTTIYDIVPSGVERKIKTKNVQCSLIPHDSGKSVFVNIENGDDKVTLSIPGFTKTQIRYYVPINATSTSERGVVMYQLKEQVRFSAMKNSFEEQLESKCKIDLTIENGQLNGVVACERLADAKALETADLHGTFSCAANE